MADLTALLADLNAESESLEVLVATLSDEDWLTPTPAPGWTIAHQIGHLAWTDDIARLAASDVEAFNAQIEKALPRLSTLVDDAAAERAFLPTRELLHHWHTGRSGLATALAAVPHGQKVPWFGPPMSPASMATARLMETWAHGQDVADALGATREPTARLQHVAHIGVRTRDFAFIANGLEPPQDSFLVELVGPEGEKWSWGPEDAAQSVRGPALDFCLLVTQRRHLDDLSLELNGTDAVRWSGIAQAFAGPPGEGRQPATGASA